MGQRSKSGREGQGDENCEEGMEGEEEWRGQETDRGVLQASQAAKNMLIDPRTARYSSLNRGKPHRNGEGWNHGLSQLELLQVLARWDLKSCIRIGRDRRWR